MRLPAYQALSKEQDRINGLPLSGNFLVSGPPGTGKTVMAIYRASLLNKKMRRATLLMYSKVLITYANSAVEEVGVPLDLVSTMHHWLEGYWKRHFNKRPPYLAPYVFDWNSILTTLTERQRGE